MTTTDEQCDIRYQEVFRDFDQLVIDNYQGNNPTTTSTAKAKYQVNADLSLSVLENSEPDKDRLFNEIWTNARKILPRAKVQSSVSQYHIDSDGESGALAYVVNDVNLPEKWVIAYDDADYSGANDPQFTHTTVHEFGHIVFLSSDQLDIRSTGSCPNYGIQEGCSFAQSYINRFYQTFWASIIDEHRALQSDEDKQRFYERYQDRFVSEYASTNPVEDAAEVFTSFVLKDKPASGDTVVNQKILLMHDIEALVNLRREIRGKLSLNRERQKRVSMLTQ